MRLPFKKIKAPGEMQGYRQGKMKGVSTGGVVLSGAGLAMVEGISKITDIAKSGKLNLSRKGIPNSQIGIQWGKGFQIKVNHGKLMFNRSFRMAQ